MRFIVVIIVIHIIMGIINAINKIKQKDQKKAEEKRLQTITQNRPQQQQTQVKSMPPQQPPKKFKQMSGLPARKSEPVAATVVQEKPSRPGLSPIAPTLTHIDSNLSSIAPTLSRIDSNLAPSHVDPHASHEEENSIALGILAMMSSPQTAQQAIVLGEILNRRNF